LANALYDEFHERGVIFVHVVIDDGPDGDNNVTWRDAYDWIHTRDFDGSGPYTPPLKVLALADYDGGLWGRFTQPCTGLTCTLSCQVTPQYQIFDQAGMTVDDYCSAPNTTSSCTQCGWNESHVRDVLNAILPPLWCGEATP
jgi:hypothetical protein